jgi:hypothetical protein
MKISVLTAMFFAFVVGFPIAAMAGLATDTDNDGIPDAMDNCSTVSNAANFCDDDTDGYGNACTSDVEPDGDTDINDFLNGFYPAFQASTANPPGVSSRYNGDCDLDTDINDLARCPAANRNERVPASRSA